MLKRHLVPLLAALSVMLAVLLAWLWLTPQGAWRDVRWNPPAPLPPALGEPPALPGTAVDLNRFVATLERPLFMPSRRPVPPPDAAASAAAPVDPLPDIRLLGVYGSQDAGGLVARIDGRVKRFRLGESIGSWSLKEIRANAVVLARGEDVRTIELRRSLGNEPAGSDSAADRPAPVAAARPAPEVEPPERAQLRERLALARDKRLNEARIRQGMPPSPRP